MLDRVRSFVAMGLFVVLALYVGWSGWRLGVLLWQRLANA
jgi:hypothetical protein